MWSVKSTLLCAAASLALSAATSNGGMILVQPGPEPASPNEAAAIAAYSVVNSARSQLHRTSVQLLRQFEQSAEYQTASQQASQALIDYENGWEGALAAWRLSPEAATADIEIDRLERQLDDARAENKLDGTDHSAKIDAIALELLDKRSAVTREQERVLGGDPNLGKLRYAWIDANAKLVSLRSEFTQGLLSDPQWTAARSQLEQARTALASISQ